MSKARQFAQNSFKPQMETKAKGSNKKSNATDLAKDIEDSNTSWLTT
jgi:hypothetical protein